MNRFLYIIFLCWISVFSLTIEAQQIVTGQITNASDGMPIPDVQIYIANSTIGTTSDASGKYSITVSGNGSIEIIVSHVGFQPVFYKIDVPNSFHQKNFALQVNEISEVTITAHSNHSQKDVDLFWRRLLGVKPSKKGLEILNSEKVYFYLNSNNVLKVSCKEPIEILNHQTGYRIRYVLQSFEHDYRNKQDILTGMPYFEEIIAQNDRQQNNWEKKRQNVYAISINRFFRALYREQIHEDGFLLTKIDYDKDTITFFPLKDILQAGQGQIQVNIESPLLLACVSKPVTTKMIENIYNTLFGVGASFPIIILKPQQFTIYSDGTYTGALKIQKYRNSIIGLSAMLPIEYEDMNSFSLSNDFQVFEQNIDNEVTKLSPFIQSLKNFSKKIAHEKIYLHFDNTSYYQNDKIWFKCYVTSAQHQLSDLSRTLYVELLNPGGEIIDKRILAIENGQCHGDFTLDRLPFYSGFYEIRAYTKYMLNFGDDVIFSRLLPVFDKPKEEGNFEEKKILKYTRWGINDYTMKRERPLTQKKVNLRFFPEGGNLVQGVVSRVAFEATDEIGNPIEVTGVVMDGEKQELCQFASQHEGRGVFTYTPTNDRQKSIAELSYAGKKYQFDLPACLPQGVVMEVDNLSHPDSIAITLRKNSSTSPEILGIAVLNCGKLQNAYYAYIEENEFHFTMDNARFPSGVSQIALFNSKGEILCDRLIFTNLNQLVNSELLDIKAKTDKQNYRPYEAVDMEISVADKDANPVNATFSLSVRDGENEVVYRQNILTDLLLMSEIKGFVRNPSYYFMEKTDTVETRRATSLLDVLLMVQGWRRYDWKQMAGIEPIEIKNLPEQGIETHGNVVSLVKQKPQPNVDVSMMLTKKREVDVVGGEFVESFVTDEQGRFSFVSNLPGRWSMILTVSEKGKKKDHRILLDRVFSPKPKRYRYADMQANVTEKPAENMNDEEMSDALLEDDDQFFLDSIAQLGIDEKVHQIPEVTIKGKRTAKERDIVRNRSTSVSYYDLHAEMDNIYDRGTYLGDNIHPVLKTLNNNFIISHDNRVIGKLLTNIIANSSIKLEDIFKGSFDENGRGTYARNEVMLYKHRYPLFIINYERAYIKDFEFDCFKYEYISQNAIKSIYINENPSVIGQYADPRIKPNELTKIYSCVVFIETYEGKIPVEGAKGVRKTWLEGYSGTSEFYSPDYSALPPEPDDYRRTLYWNPMVATDEDGKVRIKFYNNSRCTNFSISAETVTTEGWIGVYKK